MKIVKIKSCSGCPYNLEDCCDNMGKDMKYFTEEDSQTDFPEWCPLKDIYMGKDLSEAKEAARKQICEGGERLAEAVIQDWPEKIEAVLIEINLYEQALKKLHEIGGYNDGQ